MAPPPPVPQGRIATLDGLRGLAVMGILLMNITAFALPLGAYYNPLAGGGTGPADLATWALSFILVDSKMRAIFSILFGAGILLIAERGQARGRDAGRYHMRRMFWLFLFGLAHLYLIWWGDILAHYAILGLFAWFFVHKPAGKLLRTAILLFVCQCIAGLALAGTVWMLAGQASGPDASADAIAEWTALRAELGVAAPADLAREMAVMRGSFMGLVAERWGLGAPFWLLPVMGMETLGLMLLGMWGLKSGFLTGAWDRARYRRFALRCYLIGIPPMIALTAWCFAERFADPVPFTATFAGAIPLSPFIALGHAALAILWLTGGETPLRAHVRAAGRVALSNYLGTSIVMTAIFYGWGLGLFGQVSRSALLLFVLAGWAVMLAWSRPWLSRFAQGPFEWLWRTLATGKKIPMRRTDNESIAT